MNFQILDIYLQSKAYCTLDMPWGEDTFVYKVGGKLFAILGAEHDPIRLNLKNTPEKVAELKETYEDIKEGYHMNKKYWISVYVTNSLNEKLIQELIDDSYNLVFQALPQKVKINLNEANSD